MENDYKFKVGDWFFLTKRPSFAEDVTLNKKYEIKGADELGQLYFYDDAGDRNFALTYAKDYGVIKIVDGISECDELEQDFINAPKHYQLFHKNDIEGDFIEVKHVVKAVLERWEQQENISFDFYQAGCYKELLQYLLRAPLKNNIEDVQKAGYYLKEVIDEW